MTTVFEYHFVLYDIQWGANALLGYQIVVLSKLIPFFAILHAGEYYKY